MSASRKRRVRRRIALFTAMLALTFAACASNQTLVGFTRHLAVWSENDPAIEYHYVSAGLLDER